MPKSIRIKVRWLSILTSILLIHSGYARRNNLFESTNEDNILSSIYNNDRQTNQSPTKLQPSWSCILLGETGCLGTCNLMAALYGCDIDSQCRKGIYCECNEVYHFQKRDVPAKNFQTMPLEDLWNYRFQQTPESKALLTQLLNDNVMREYTSNLLRDAHITGEDVQFVMGGDFPELTQQLQKLIVKPHGLKSELAINGELEYDNIGDYFSDLFQSIKKKVSEKIESAKSKRRILELIRNIDNEEDLQYVLRQILLSGDDKLYNFVSSYLRRNGHSFEDESVYQPRRRFGRRRRGCRKRKRCGGGRGEDMDYDNPPGGGAWHGRPLKRKIVITHNDAIIKIEADEDEVIEIALINELKKAEEMAGAEAARPSRVQEQVIQLPPKMKPVSQEIPTSAPSQGNTFMQGMMPGFGNTYMQGIPSQGYTYLQGIPSQGNTYLQGTMGPLINSPQVPLGQDKVELYSVLPGMNQYARPTMSTPMQGNTFTQGTFVPQLPVLPDYQESYSTMRPVNSMLPSQELLPPLMTDFQLPTVQQIQHEIITPPQMRPMPLELPHPTTSQYSAYVQESMPSISAPINQMEETLTSLHTPNSPSSGYSVIQEAMAPISMNMAQVPTMYSKEDISISPPQMGPIPLISPQNNLLQETMTPLLPSTVQPLMHQIEEELPQISHMKPVSNEVPLSSYLTQETLSPMIPENISHTLSNIITNNDMDLPPLMNQDTIEHNMEYVPEIETSQSYSSLKPVLQQLENTLSTMPTPSTTTFYADQSPELRLPMSQTTSFNSPQTVYEYINSASNMPSLIDLENSPPSMSSFDFNLEDITPPRMPSLIDLETPSMSSSNFNLGNLSPPKMPSLSYLENSTPSMSSLTYEYETPNMSSSNFNLGNLSPSNMPSLSYLENSTPSMSSVTYEYETPNMANQLGNNFQNTMSNLPSPSMTSYINQGLPQNSYISQTSNLPGLNGNMEWMTMPSTFSTMPSNLGSMMPQSSWFSQTSNVTPQSDTTSTSTNSGLTWLQGNMPGFKESTPTSQTLNKSFIHEDIPRFIQKSETISTGNSDEEFRVNKIPKISENGFSNQHIKNEIEEVADNFTTETVQQSNKMLPSVQNVESNMSMQQGPIPDPKKKKSLFYMVIDDSGNVVHSASVDHEAERGKQATPTTSMFPFIPSYFSQTAPGKENQPQNYGWPYWSK